MSEFAVTSKGQVTIPKEVRQQLGIRTGTKVRFCVEGRQARLEVVSPAAPSVGSAAGMLPHRPATLAVPADFDVASLLDPSRRS